MMSARSDATRPAIASNSSASCPYIAFNIYVASSRQLNLTKQADSGLNKLSKQRGEALAKEFDKVIQGSAYGARLAKRPRVDKISRDELDELARPLAVAAIPRGERAPHLSLPPRNARHLFSVRRTSGGAATRTTPKS
jgi:hypothetical protein